ncbi:hypothetical protein IKW73_02565 [Candidatus Saccharibacteria bacterium]|nr:hypothetical protein [Candidatus Saccharibacteria bacterium]
MKSCSECPLHKRERVYTPDSFEYVQGIYCDDTKEDNLVYSYEGSDSEKANIPAWCPFIIAQYKEIISDFSGRRNYTCNGRILEGAKSILEMIGDSSFNSVSYPLATKSLIERDKCLVHIALFEDSSGKKTDVINGLNFFNDDDPEIIRESKKFLSGKIGYEELLKRCDDPKNRPNKRLLLNTELAVPLALILSREMNECFCTSFSYLEGRRTLDFVEHENKSGSMSVKEAELYFDNFLVDLRKNKRQLWNETEKHLMIIEEILSRVFGIKKLKLFVDEEPLRRPRKNT